MIRHVLVVISNNRISRPDVSQRVQLIPMRSNSSSSYLSIEGVTIIPFTHFLRNKWTCETHLCIRASTPYFFRVFSGSFCIITYVVFYILMASRNLFYMNIPAVCQVVPLVTFPRSSNTALTPRFVSWYNVLHPAIPPPRICVPNCDSSRRNSSVIVQLRFNWWSYKCVYKVIWIYIIYEDTILIIAFSFTISRVKCLKLSNHLAFWLLIKHCIMATEKPIYKLYERSCP